MHIPPGCSLGVPRATCLSKLLETFRKNLLQKAETNMHTSISVITCDEKGAKRYGHAHEICARREDTIVKHKVVLNVSTQAGNVW